ncbi:O-methyltransferase [Candidatus Karelsulcia muelleri]
MILYKKLIAYILKLLPKEKDYLKKLSITTKEKTECNKMSSDHYQGRFLSLISRIISPKTILEIGTYTGYSTLCLAEGLKTNGKIITIEINKRCKNISEKFFKKYNKNILTIYGKAKNILPKINIKLDLAFIDADKRNNLHYFNSIADKIRTNGIIIVDNVLWKKKVFFKTDNKAKHIDKFNKKIKMNKKFDTLIIPIRDGLSISLKN